MNSLGDSRDYHFHDLAPEKPSTLSGLYRSAGKVAIDGDVGSPSRGGACVPLLVSEPFINVFRL